MARSILCVLLLACGTVDAYKCSPTMSRRAAIMSAPLVALPAVANAGFAGGNPSGDAAAAFQAKKAAAAAAETAERTTKAGYKSYEDAAPRSFAELVANSKAQREAALGMTMSDAEVAKMTEKLRQQFPGVQ
jgi:hypothetical protein